MKDLTIFQLLSALLIGGLVGFVAWHSMNQSLEKRQVRFGITKAIDSMRVGDHLARKNQQKEALSMYKTSLKTINKKNEPIAYANIKNSQGVCYYKMALKENSKLNLAKAITSYKEALAVYKNDGRLSDFAIALINIGDAYKELAQYQNTEKNKLEAIKVYKEALKIYRTEDYPDKNEMVKKKISHLSK